MKATDHIHRCKNKIHTSLCLSSLAVYFPNHLVQGKPNCTVFHAGTESTIIAFVSNERGLVFYVQLYYKKNNYFNHSLKYAWKSHQLSMRLCLIWATWKAVAVQLLRAGCGARNLDVISCVIFFLVQGKTVFDWNYFPVDWTIGDPEIDSSVAFRPNLVFFMEFWCTFWDKRVLLYSCVLTCIITLVHKTPLYFLHNKKFPNIDCISSTQKRT